MRIGRFNAAMSFRYALICSCSDHITFVLSVMLACIVVHGAAGTDFGLLMYMPVDERSG